MEEQRPAVSLQSEKGCLAGPWLTQKARLEERNRKKVGRFDVILRPNGKLGIAT